MTSPKPFLPAIVCVLAMSGCALERGAGRPTDNSAGITDAASERDASPLVSLRGDKSNSIAWAPLSDPDDVTVEGSVPRSRAWSTSKVLVIAAYLDIVVNGDPDRIPADVSTFIRSALTRSDEPSINAIRRQVPHSQRAMTRILRGIGDTRTEVPGAYEGTMQWSVREQVRFMAALANGRVVSPQASAFLLREMQPIASQRWGLGTIGARAFKPGWMNNDAESRQMGIVGDFAVAIITMGNPGTPSGTGDFAHARQLNRLAQLLAKRLDEGRCFASDLFGWQARWCLFRAPT